ncbi:MAG: hypothetical protein QM820_20905 [Minicystis sp.]
MSSATITVPSGATARRSNTKAPGSLTPTTWKARVSPVAWNVKSSVAPSCVAIVPRSCSSKPAGTEEGNRPAAASAGSGWGSGSLPHPARESSIESVMKEARWRRPEGWFGDMTRLHGGAARRSPGAK